MSSSSSSTTLASTDPKHRVRNTCCVLPIIYGTASREIADASSHDGDAAATHRWCVFVRGRRGDEDLSSIISRVAFHLHDSFDPPVRVVDRPPFVVAAVGWGEFELRVRVHFVDELERPVELWHTLKLHASDTVQPVAPGAPLVSATYDELVFNDPPAPLHAALMSPCARLDVAALDELTMHAVDAASLPLRSERGDLARMAEVEREIVGDLLVLQRQYTLLVERKRQAKERERDGKKHARH